MLYLCKRAVPSVSRYSQAHVTSFAVKHRQPPGKVGLGQQSLGSHMLVHNSELVVHRLPALLLISRSKSVRYSVGLVPSRRRSCGSKEPCGRATLSAADETGTLNCAALCRCRRDMEVARDILGGGGRAGGGVEGLSWG